MPTGIPGTFSVNGISYPTRKAAASARRKLAAKVICILCKCRAGHGQFEQPQPMLYASLKTHTAAQHLNHATEAVMVLSIKRCWLQQILSGEKTTEWRDVCFGYETYPALILLQMSKTGANKDPRAGRVVAACMIHAPEEPEDIAERPSPNYHLCYALTDLHVFAEPFLFKGQATAITPTNKQRAAVSAGVLQKANCLFAD